MNNPLVSILVLTFQQKQFVNEALNSLQEQSYENWEAIVVDDASLDGTKEHLQQSDFNNDSRFQFIYNSENVGIGQSLNIALEKAKGEFISILACDDILLRDKIKQQIAAIENASVEVHMIYTDAYLLDGDQTKKTSFISEIGKRTLAPFGDVYDELLKLNFIPTPTVLLRKSILDEMAGFSTDLFIEDYDLWLRISEKYQIHFLREKEVIYRLHAENNIKKMNNWLLYKIKVLAKLKRITKVFKYQLNHSFYHYYIQNPKHCQELLAEHPHGNLLFSWIRNMIQNEGSPRFKGRLLKVLSLFYR